LDRATREYLTVVRDLLDKQIPAGWLVGNVLASLDCVLTSGPVGLDHETDYLRVRLAEVERARQSNPAPGRIPLPSGADLPERVRGDYEREEER
jgi:hypothetical protein